LAQPEKSKNRDSARPKIIDFRWQMIMVFSLSTVSVVRLRRIYAKCG
jgi:hypothetical protein